MTVQGLCSTVAATSSCCCPKAKTDGGSSHASQWNASLSIGTVWRWNRPGLRPSFLGRCLALQKLEGRSRQLNSPSCVARVSDPTSARPANEGGVEVGATRLGVPVPAEARSVGSSSNGTGNGVVAGSQVEVGKAEAEKVVPKSTPQPVIKGPPVAPSPRAPVLRGPVAPIRPTPPAPVRREASRNENGKVNRVADRPGVWRRDRDGPPTVKPPPESSRREAPPAGEDNKNYKVVYRPAAKKTEVVGSGEGVPNGSDAGSPGRFDTLGSGADREQGGAGRPTGQVVRPVAPRPAAAGSADENDRPNFSRASAPDRIQLERPPPRQIERPVRIERPAAQIERPPVRDASAFEGRVFRPGAAGPRSGAEGVPGRSSRPTLGGPPRPTLGGPPKPAPAASPAGDKWGKKAAPGAAVRRKRGPGGGGSRDEDDDGRGMLAAMGLKVEGMAPRRPARKRKGRSFRARQRAAVRAAKAGVPVRVEILEVPATGMTVEELAQNLAIDGTEIIKSLFMKGIMATVNQTLDEDTVKVVCAEYDVEVLEAGTLRPEDMAKKTDEFIDEGDLENLEPRPPVVTIMGHVDHGKTSLLDYIRKTRVAKGEAGGITQSIGAYKVTVPIAGEDQTCVFLDTPGHEAFSAMRARGARVTDIAIIVVAADDGVRPQSLEAISHAKAADVPIIIAINKVDKDGASPDRVKQELSAQGLMPEEWGGDTPMVEVSAKQGTGVDDLLETVMLVAEMEDLQANPNRAARGTVIEASLDRKRGPLATVLVQTGTLHRGDVILCGEAYGKVRSLYDHTGAQVDEAGPSMAVQVLGLSGVPVAGDVFEGFEALEEARSRAEEFGATMRVQRLAMQSGESAVSLQSLAAAAQVQEQGLEFGLINVILKVDNSGSIEAVRAALDALPQDTVRLRYLLSGPGEVSVSDVDLALASRAVVIGFNTGPGVGVEAHAKDVGVELRSYDVIYDLVDDMRKAMEGMLEPEEERVPLGEADVRAIFGAGSGKAAGCMVVEGKLVKGCQVAVMRKGKEVYTGPLDSLRRIKEIVKEVPQGLECGVSIEAFTDWKEGDKISAFDIVTKTRTLESASAISSKALEAVASKVTAA